MYQDTKPRYGILGVLSFAFKRLSREFKLRVIRQTANARQRKILRYQAIKSKFRSCCFKTEIHNYSFDARKKIWNENVQRKFCQESSNLPFAVPGNVKLKLPIIKWQTPGEGKKTLRYKVINGKSTCYFKTYCNVWWSFWDKNEKMKRRSYSKNSANKKRLAVPANAKLKLSFSIY
jgi:hypothetical protein